MALRAAWTPLTSNQSDRERERERASVWEKRMNSLVSVGLSISSIKHLTSSCIQLLKHSSPLMLCWCSCGSVVEHCVSSAKGCGFNSQGTHILTKTMYNLNKLLWMSAKCINVNVAVSTVTMRTRWYLLNIQKIFVILLQVGKFDSFYWSSSCWLCHWIN